jgi:peptidoglycan/LPS O-acetylase OafA/YrhL
MKFNAIEGLRGWLAWIVVFAHLSFVSGIYAKSPGAFFGRLGLPAVLMFIIISGFVITHLIVERPEPYRSYLIRRFMRIFPLFAITCAVGVFTFDLQATTLAQTAYESGFAATVAEMARSNHDFFWGHVLAHLTMLHGAISDHGFLPYSEHAFNIPAWSVSLEWQFYIVAPFVILSIRRPGGMFAVAAAVALLTVASRAEAFGSFDNPSFLPAAAGYFAVGIASRLFYPTIARAACHQAVVAALAIVLLPICNRDTAPLLLWAVVLSGLTLAPADATPFARLYRAALESRAPVYWGSRSYSVYLGHMPVIALCHLLWITIWPATGSTATFVGVTVLAVPATMIAAELLYRWIERPGIALGARMARARRLEQSAGAAERRARPRQQVIGKVAAVGVVPEATVTETLSDAAKATAGSSSPSAARNRALCEPDRADFP